MIYLFFSLVLNLMAVSKESKDAEGPGNTNNENPDQTTTRGRPIWVFTVSTVMRFKILGKFIYLFLLYY